MSSVAATPLDFRSLSHTQTHPPILLLRPKGRGLRRAHPRLSNTTLSLDGLPPDAATVPSASTTTVAAPLEGPPVKGPHHRGRPSKALINREMCVRVRAHACARRLSRVPLVSVVLPKQTRARRKDRYGRNHSSVGFEIPRTDSYPATRTGSGLAKRPGPPPRSRAYTMSSQRTV